MSYTCANCKRSVDFDEYNANVRCPYCGHRVWIKDRARNTKAVSVG